MAEKLPTTAACWTCPRRGKFTVTKGLVVRAACSHHLALCVRTLAEAVPHIENCNVYVGGIRG